MRKNADKSPASRTAGRILRWSLASLLVMAAAYLAFLLLGRIACRAAIARVERITNTAIQAGSIILRPTGSVRITALDVRNPALPPDRSLVMQAATVHAALDLPSLLLLKPRIKRIDVNDFTFNLEYDADTQRWNLPEIDLQPPSGRKGKTPLIKLDHGTLRYVKSAAGHAKTNASLPIVAAFGLNAAIPEAYGFEITATPAGLAPSRLTGAWKPGYLQLAATIAPADIGEITMPWAIDALTASSGNCSPNSTTLGFITPPQSPHRGTSSEAKKPSRRSSVGTVLWHLRQLDSRKWPCSSRTSREPAFWCRPSIFCVMTACRRPAASRSDSAM